MWGTVVLALVMMGILTYMCYRQSNNEYHNADAAETASFGFYSPKSNKTVFRVFFWILVVIDVIMLLLIFFLCDRIKLSITILKLVSIILAKSLTLIVFQVITYICLFAFWAYVIAIAILLYGAGTPVQVYSEEKEVNEIVYQYDKNIQYATIYHFIGFIWISLFILDFSVLVIAGVFSSRYFTREGEDPEPSAVWESFKRSLRYHIGSIAFGSFLITLCKLIRIVLEYLDEKTKNSTNSCVRFVIKCLKCYMWCLEKFLKFLNRRAYVLIAIRGKSFFQSCKDAFSLIMRNIIRVTITNWVGDFALFLGKIFISFGVTALALYVFGSKIENITFPIIPAIVVFLMSFIVAGAFTSLYEIGIDSVFVSYMVDEEMNDGTPGREMFASDDIKNSLKK